MKKNAMMKIAAILMVAVLLTTCAISSTFAKYVTSGTSDDSARVAAFGVTVATNFKTLFASTYDGEGDVSVNNDSTTYTASDLVAPGTAGGVTTASVITGKPEVAVAVVTTADVNLGDKWVLADGTFYCPVVFTINGTAYSYDKVTDQNEDSKVDAADFEIVLENAIKAANNKQFPANTDLGTANLNVSIEWAWAFTVEDDSTTPDVNEAKVADVNDTYLGDQAAADKAGAISITLTQSVTQLDKYTPVAQS